MDNLGLLSSSKRLQRDRATLTVRYKFLADWLIQDFMRSTGLAIVLIRSRIWAFDLYKYRWPWMTLNAEMALILHYFTEFVYDVVVKQLLVLPRFHNMLLIVYDHINTICPLIQHYLCKTNSDNSVWWYAMRIDDWLHYIDYHWRLVTVEIRNSVQWAYALALHVRCRRKTLTFAISFSDELLSPCDVMMIWHADWMLAGYVIHLHPAKTVLIWMGSKQQQEKIVDHEVPISSSSIKTVDTARDIGVVLDSYLTMSAHVSSVSQRLVICASCVCRLMQPRQSSTRVHFVATRLL